jgi:hypothetical protein
VCRTLGIVKRNLRQLGSIRLEECDKRVIQDGGDRRPRSSQEYHAKIKKKALSQSYGCLHCRLSSHPPSNPVSDSVLALRALVVPVCYSCLQLRDCSVTQQGRILTYLESRGSGSAFADVQSVQSFLIDIVPRSCQMPYTIYTGFLALGVAFLRLK